MEHIEDDILLTLPKIPELTDPTITDEMLMQNKKIIEEIEEIVMLWEKHIQKVSAVICVIRYIFVFSSYL